MGLNGIENLIIVSDGQNQVAFMGIQGSKIEMLFVSPDCFGKGIGRELIEFAIAKYKVRYVDVNEQNPQATGFYSHIGFKVFERTELDEQGNPFPILRMKLCPFSIRQATHDDIEEIKELFKSTVLTINGRDYSQEEVEDWASCGEDISKISEMIESHYFIVAINRSSQIVGFSSVTSQGYLHSMFVHKDFQGKGIATLLLNDIEQFVKENGITKITSEVSLTARPFFEKQGYIVTTEQKRQANKLCLTNFWMAKEMRIIKTI
ncbi:GNAT family N-acetyltransferase [Sanguibacteroides sp. AM78-02pH3A]|uniref:GNAT family N-acetyltransferase n=1 Tax=Sanguibacteroides sp. AM78-02pH3A TaxID=3002646 RepID=UPI0022DFFAFF|nr:GNAT family N-acetyltransferase [Sanguibacteroides sp. AM78-02pH3A]